MNIKVKKNNSKVLIMISGRTLVSEMEKLKKILLENLTYNQIDLDISEISHRDFSFYQIIISFLKTIKDDKDKVFKIIDNADSDFVINWGTYGFDHSLIEENLHFKERVNGK